jgi:hypothetical protein
VADLRRRNRNELSEAGGDAHGEAPIRAFQSNGQEPEQEQIRQHSRELRAAG